MSTPKRSSTLDAQKQALLDALLHEEGLASSSAPVIPRRKSDDSLPLSFAQQRLWFLDQLLPGNAFYNIAAALPMRVPLSISVLQQSLNEIVRRHEVLRTRFSVENGEPVQVVQGELSLPLPVTDLRHLSGQEQEAEAQRLATAEAQQPFDLSTGPLLRTSLLRQGENDYVFLLTMHHIVTDGWSMRLFFEELSTLYRAYGLGGRSPLPELPIQYADYAVWQREWLSGEVLEEQLRYWQEQLRELPLLQMPTDESRPAVQSFRGAQQQVALGEQLTGQLRRLSQQQGTTLFMTLLAAFKVLLYRYTGQGDIVVGSPIAGRNRAEIEGLIGFFVNTLVLRTRLRGEMSFREVLGAVKEVCLGAYAHQDLPFEMLVEKLQPERDLSRNPLFQITFQLLNNARGGETATGAEAAAGPQARAETAKFDLTLDLWEGPGPQEVTGRLEYNTDIFTAERIERLTAHYERLLQAIVTAPEERISRLPLLSAVEREQQVVEWNRTAQEYERETCVHELFARQAARTPEQVAVRYGEQQWSYGELEQRSNQLAQHLRRRGVGVETLVGVMVERSVEMAVSLLAVLKAGGAYVPLDASYPSERLQLMMRDARLRLVLTQAALSERLGANAATETILIDKDWEQIAQESGESPAVVVMAENLAYVMYTSGSTGQPKGVAIPHQAINRLVFNTNYIELNASDKVAQASNSSFDAATFEIWGALLHGAEVVVISREQALSPSEFAATLREKGITTLFLTTSLFNQLVSEEPRIFESVHHLLFGGSAADVKTVRQVLEKGSPKRFLNVYGPTESTTFAAWYLITEAKNGLVPIGAPISNTELYIVNEELEPVPVGVAGQLMIGGDGLARGYLDHPEVTAEKFIPDPFSGRLGARLYHTGDVAHYRSDGAIEFLGRLDGQIKLRGFRIEIGEVEAALSGHPAVSQAAVVAREAERGDKSLTAYVVGNNGDEISITDLRGYLREKLPDYMVPGSYIIIPELPLTPNGKVDYRALPQPETSLSQSGAAYVAPQNAMEQTIASVWQEMLQVDRVGTQDNFFDLGGHSLLLVKVQRKLRDLLKKDIMMTDLFRYPTIGLLAGFLSTGQEASTISQAQDRARRQRETLSRRKPVVKGRLK